MISGKRRLVRAACFILAIALLWPLPFWTSAPKLVLQISPLVALSDSLALRSVGIGTGIGLVFAAIGVFKRRWFCRYACPVGFLLDGLSGAGLKKTSWWARCIPLGRFAALLTVAGAAVGYPFLLWMDPLALFSSSLSIRAAGGVAAGIEAGLGIGILAALSLASGAIWCGRICPLGGLLDLLASLKNPFNAAQDLPAQAPPVRGTRHQAAWGRRSFLFVLAGAGIGLLARWRRAKRSDDAPLRPPGAVSETNFAGLCLRCGNCSRACPSGIIHQDAGAAGALGLLAPAISYEKNYCIEDCNACTQVCPSGAIRPLDLDRKRKYQIGGALADLTLCVLALGEGDCDACMRACPFDAVHIHWDEEQYVAYPVVDRNRCNGCGACEVACPARNGKAIRVWKRLTAEA